MGTDVVAEDETAKREPFYLYTRQQGLWPQEVVGHDPDKERSLFDPLCPLRNVTASYPPTLLLHGDNDTDVPFAQSVLMAKELERQGVPQRIHCDAGQRAWFRNDMSDPMIAATFDRVPVLPEEAAEPVKIGECGGDLGTERSCHHDACSLIRLVAIPVSRLPCRRVNFAGTVRTSGDATGRLRTRLLQVVVNGASHGRSSDNRIDVTPEIPSLNPVSRTESGTCDRNSKRTLRRYSSHPRPEQTRV